MRIVAGRLRGRALAAPEGDAIRPTSDRARQSLFNILEHGAPAKAGLVIRDAIVLDVFCGTGAFGLEALSRGARYAWIPGHWENAPPGQSWYGPRYVNSDGSYFYQQGGWRPRASAMH